MKKRIFILTLFLVILIGIGTVSAETLTGNLGATGWNSTNVNTGYTHYWGWPGAASHGQFHMMFANNIENTGGFQSLVRWNSYSTLDQFDTGAPAGVSIPCKVYWTNNTLPNITSGDKPQYWDYFDTPEYLIGEGTIGYQRIFNGATPPVEQLDGYMYLVMDSWNVTGRSGDYFLYVEYDNHLFYNASWSDYGYASYTSVPNNMVLWNEGASPDGWITYNSDDNIHASYTVTKPQGLGIQGYVNKSSLGETDLYNSRAYISNSTRYVITSDITSNSDAFLFNVPNEQIYISVLSPQGNWGNSSLLFSVGGITPTPTPTPTPTDPGAVPTVAPGYVRTNVYVWDRGGNMIHGANIDIKDIGTSTWTNSTHDADGISYIDTLPYDQISIYGSYDVFADEFLPNSLLNQDTGPAGYTYYLTLYPYESGVTEGNVSLYVEVKDADSGSYIPYANVQIVLSNGYSYSGSTANLGSKVFIVPNNTVVHATGSASGYLSATTVANSGSGGSMTMTVSLHKQVVTTRPTSTIPPGGITPAITIDPRSASQKDTDMMDQIRTAGPTLIELAIAVTMISLLGLMTKGFGK